MYINRTDLNPAVRRFIKRKEEELNQKCYAIWEFKNPKDERFLFGRYGKLREENTIVTIASFNPHVCGGWLPPF